MKPAWRHIDTVLLGLNALDLDWTAMPGDGDGPDRWLACCPVCPDGLLRVRWDRDWSVSVVDPPSLGVDLRCEAGCDELSVARALRAAASAALADGERRAA